MGNGGGGKEAQKEEDICKLIADSRWTEETSTCKAIIIQLKINLKSKKKYNVFAGVQPRWIQGIQRVDGVGEERLIY